jgi:hypothetical protein
MFKKKNGILILLIAIILINFSTVQGKNPTYLSERLPNVPVTGIKLYNTSIDIEVSSEDEELNYLTRQEFAKFLVKTFDLKSRTEKVDFPDVPEHHPYYEYIQAVVAHGIMRGWPDGSFSPESTVRISEYVYIVFKALKYEDIKPISVKLIISVSSEIENAYKNIADAGIMEYDKWINLNSDMILDTDGQLIPVISPPNATNRKVTWTSSDESIAVVDKTGRVIGKRPGTAIITVTTDDGNFTGTCKVNVNEKYKEPEEEYKEPEEEYKEPEEEYKEPEEEYKEPEEEYKEPEEEYKEPVEDEIMLPVFKDLQNHWSKNATMKLYEGGMIKGYEDGTIRPDNEITREEAAVLIARAFSLDPSNDTDMHFDDHNQISDWAKGYVTAARQWEFIKGYPDNTFRPKDKITRQELITMYINTFIAVSIPDDELEFADKELIGEWARDSILIAVKSGIISGYPDNTFRPRNNITRAETFAIFANSEG